MWALILVLVLPLALGAGALSLDRAFRDVRTRPRLPESDVAEDVSSG